MPLQLSKRAATLDLSRVSQLANHMRKYVRAVERDLRPLQQAVRARGRASRLDWNRLPGSVSRQMRLIRECAPDPATAARWVGTFFAWHYLGLTHRRLRALNRALRSGDDPTIAYRRLTDRIRKGYRTLIAGYTSNLLELFGGGRGSPELAFAITGNLADHEDVDVLVLARDEEAARAAGAVVSRMSTEFLRYASRLHFYLAEQLGDTLLAGTPERYLTVFSQESRDFVAATQLIGAQYIAGSRALFNAFDREVARRYRFRGRGAVYEGFVRDVLHAVDEILRRATGIEHIHPKREVYLPVKDIVYIAKVRYSVAPRDLFELLDRLPRLDARHADAYHALQQALAFVECYRYLHQVCVVQEEHMDVGDPATHRRLVPVAQRMGFDSTGALIQRYFVVRENCHRAIRELSSAFGQHLRRLNIFRRLSRRQTPGNLAVNLLRFLTLIGGEVFWEDLFEMAREDHTMTTRFLRDLEALPAEERNVVVRRLVTQLMQDPRMALEGIAALSTGARVLVEGPAVERFAEHAAARVEQDEQIASKLVEAFYDFPDTVDRFAQSVPPAILDRFVEALAAHPGRDYRKARNKLLLLTVARHYSSNYAQRLFHRALPEFPEAVAFIDDSRELLRAADTYLNEVEDIHSYEQRKRRIGDVFALHFLRAATDTLTGRPIEEVSSGYMRASDRVVNGLYRICRDEVRMRSGDYRDISSYEDFALFAAGGNAREEAFDVDYDLIAVLDGEDPHRRAFFEKVMARLTVALARIGVMPHNRLADLTGRYVVSMNELSTLLGEEPEVRFIEMSEVLGARRVIGSPKLDFEFAHRIVSKGVLARADTFKKLMLGEMQARFEYARQSPDSPWNIKEDPGGLRDIHMFLQILRAHYQVRQPITRLAVDALASGDAEIRVPLLRVYEALQFLMRLRDLYRLTVAAQDDLDPTQLELCAGLMGYQNPGELLSALERHCVAANRAIADVLEGMGLQ